MKLILITIKNDEGLEFGYNYNADLVARRVGHRKNFKEHFKMLI